MTMPMTFSDVIELWPTAAELAREISVKEVTVRAWKFRTIPAEYWKDIEAAAKARGLAVSIDDLAEMAARDAGRGASPALPPETAQ